MFWRFSDEAEQVVKTAKETAVRLGQEYIGTEHLLYGLLCAQNGIASMALQKMNVREPDLAAFLHAFAQGMRVFREMHPATIE